MNVPLVTKMLSWSCVQQTGLINANTFNISYLSTLLNINLCLIQEKPQILALFKTVQEISRLVLFCRRTLKAPPANPRIVSSIVGIL